jgi:hypothetical protein
VAGERFQVRSVVGYRIMPGAPRQRSSSGDPGVSVSVLDRLDAWREVRVFQSEPDVPGQTRRLGVLGALKAGEALAAELNAEAACAGN